MARSPRPARVATSVLVEPGAHATPGAAAFLRVHARNVTTSTRDLVVSVVGLEGGWLPAPVSVPGVVPDATVTVELALLPPVGAAPGDYPFVVAVESHATPPAPQERATTLADGSLRVDGVSGLLLSVEPADSTGVRSKRVQVVLANTGDRSARVELDARADAATGGFVHLDARALEVAPHSSVRIGARAGVRRAQVFGTKRRAAFHVTATGDRAPQRFDAAFTARPLLPGSALRATAVLGVAVLWVGMVLAALPWLSDQFSGSGRSVDEQAGNSATPRPGSTTDGSAGGGAAPGTGGGGPGDGSGDGSGGGAGGGTGPGEADEGVRVSGVVTSSDPSAVTVQVVPAGALPAASEQAGSSDGTTSDGTASDGTASDGTAADGTATGSSAAGAGAVIRQAGYVQVDAAAARAVVAAPADESQAPIGKISGLALPVERADVASQRRTTTTGADGAWAFAGLSATGRYLLTFAKAGYETQRFWVTGAEAAAAPLELALTPGRGRLAGVVTGPSGPAGGVVLTISDGTTTVTTRTATSGSVGRWEVDGLSTPSTYLVTASSDTLGAQSALATLPAAGSRTVNLTLRAGVATLAGLVSGRDARGGQGGLGGVRVTARAGDVERSATTVTGDRRGTFVLPGLPVPGRYTLTFEADGYSTQTRRVDLTAGGLDELPVTLASIGGTVNGTARDETGAGVAAAGLTLTGTAGTFKTMSSSDATGTYRFDGIPAGEYTLVAEAFGHEPASAQVTVVGSRPATAELVLRTLEGDGLEATSTIVGRATDAGTGARITCPHLLPGEKCELTVSTVVRSPGEPARTVTVRSQPDRPYELPASGERGLYPGLYRLTLSAPGYEPATVDVTVPMGQVVEAATVAMYPSPSIVGSVSARIGVVPTTTCVVAVPAGEPAPGADPCRQVDDTCESAAGACAFIGLNGSYQIDRLSKGGYTVHVIPPASADYVRPDPVSVTLTPGDVKRVDWLLDRLGVLFVSVYSTDGTGSISPANGATVTAEDGTTTRGATTVDGVARISGLPRGTYTVTATAVSGQTGEATGVQVGLNQEVQTQVVLTRATGDVTMRVVTLLGGTSETPVGGARVTVSGVTGYRGVTLVQSTGTPVAVTTSTGRFTVCTAASGCSTDPEVTALALVENRMDVRVTADGYEPYAQNGVDTTTTAPITLTPTGRAFTGNVVLEGSTNPALEYGDVEFSVTAAPPGVGQISITAASDGTLTWNDSQQPVGSGLIRPGLYKVEASLAGYLSLPPVTLDVLPNQPAPALTVTLRKFGLLRIAVESADTHEDVFGTVITVTRNGTSERRTALPGDEFVDFGQFAPGSYPVEVRAAGFARYTGTVVVTAGQGIEPPWLISLVRLGTIEGTVKSQITPMLVQDVSGALVEGRGPSDVRLSTTTATNGTYSLTGSVETAGLAFGSWQLTASAAGYRSPADDTDTITVGVPSSVPVTGQNLMLDPEPASLTLFATNQGAPAPGLTVRLTYNDGSVPPPAAIPPTCAGPVTDPGPCVDTAAGTYVFRDLKPLTYTLTISGDGFSPLSMPVTIAAGEIRSMTVPVTAPNGSIQGIVQLQQADGSMTNVSGVDVTLDPADPGAASRTATTGTDGRYRFPTVPAGSYTLSVSDDGLSASRVVVLQPGDGLVVDLILTVRTFSLAVTVNSSSDLTGALVNVTSGTTARAAQPVVRSGTNRFTTTFSQLPAGTWTVALSGPSGHLGVWTQDVTISNADATATFTVAETQVRLRATSAVTGAPGTVAATVSPTSDGDPRDVTLAVGGSDTVLWLPNTGASVTASVTGGWGLTVNPTTIAAGATFQLVTITVEPVATTIAVTSSPATVDVGDDVAVAVRVTAGAAAVTAGQAVLERNVGGTWTQIDTGTLATGGANAGTVTLSASTAGWPGGAASLRVRYAGSGLYAASSNVTVPAVTIVLPTAVELTATATVLTATVTTTASGNPAGTVSFQVRITGTWTDIAGCTARPVSTTTGIATCTPSPALAASSAVRARFVGSSSTWATSAWTEAQTPAAGP